MGRSTIGRIGTEGRLKNAAGFPILPAAEMIYNPHCFQTKAAA